MSVFTSLLLALAALLATVHGMCTTKHVGRYSESVVNYNPISFSWPGVSVMLDQNYCQPPLRVIGEDIEACNNDPNGPAPSINGPPEGSWSYTVTCVDECTLGGTTTVKQYCGY